MADNATLYISDPCLIGSRLFKKIEGITHLDSFTENGKATGFKFHFEGSIFHFNLMTAQELEIHLPQFEKHAKQTWNGTPDDLLYFLGRLRFVHGALGCVVEPGFDDKGVVANFLVRFNSQFNGILFIYDSIVDLDGTLLSGKLKED